MIDVGEPAELYPSHYYPRLVRKRTGVQLKLIVRSKLNILLFIDNGAPRWNYEEFGRKRCELSVPGVLPATVLSAAEKRPLSVLVGGYPYLGSREIIAATDDGLWTTLALKVGWSAI